MDEPKQPDSERGKPDSFEFSSRHLRTVDKGRMSLPPEWRKPGCPTEFALLPWPLWDPQYLLALPPLRWETMRRNIVPESLSDERGMELQRLVHAKVTHRTLDDYGRLPLPEEAVKKFALDQQVLLIGMDDKFEIWPAPAGDQAISNLDPLTIKTYVTNKKL